MRAITTNLVNSVGSSSGQGSELSSGAAVPGQLTTKFSENNDSTNLNTTVTVTESVISKRVYCYKKCWIACFLPCAPSFEITEKLQVPPEDSIRLLLLFLLAFFELGRWGADMWLVYDLVHNESVATTLPYYRYPAGTSLLCMSTLVLLYFKYVWGSAAFRWKGSGRLRAERGATSTKFNTSSRSYYANGIHISASLAVKEFISMCVCRGYQLSETEATLDKIYKSRKTLTLAEIESKSRKTLTTAGQNL